MKKALSFLLSAALSISMLTACSSGETATSQTEAPTSAETTAAEISDSTANNKTTEKQSTVDETISETDDTTEDTVIIRVGGLKGPTTMGLVKLMDDAANGLVQNQYDFTMVTAADELTAMIASNQIDIALLPANVASVLYNKTQGKVNVIDINTLGVLYLVSGDTSISSIEQLAGKTVYLTGKGTTPEYSLRYLLSAAGLDDGDITLEFKSEATEVASVLAEHPDAIGLLPQPFVSSALAQNEKLSIIMDLAALWDEIPSEGTKSRLVTGVTIASKTFLNEHPELVDTFLDEHRESIAFADSDPDTTAELIAAAGIVPKAPLAKKALPYCNIAFLSGDEMKEALSGYLEVLFEQNPASVGGKLPDDAFYYLP